MNIDQWLRSQARFLPEKLAIIYRQPETAIPNDSAVNKSANEYSLTFKSLDQRVEAVAHLLCHRCELKKGDRIAWLGLNHPDMFVLLFAAARLGVIVVPMSWRLSVDELSYIADDCEPKVVFHDAHEAKKAAALLSAKTTESSVECVLIGDAPEGQKGLDYWVDEMGDLNQDALSAKSSSTHSESEREVVLAEDPCLIVYTSGTTGRPKGSVLSHDAMVCNALMSQHMYGLSQTDVVLNVLPLFHVGGINIQPLPALMFGATLILHQQFSPAQCMKEITQSRVTLINTVPTILQALQDTDEWIDTDFKFLKSISIGSTDVPRPLIDAVNKTGIPLVQVYGATETGPIAIYQRPEHGARNPGSIGQAGLLCDVLLVDADGAQVPTGMSGEICIKGKNILTEYWNNKDATNDAIRDGWFHTGDVAHVDEQGTYWFDDRLKHVIISGGENIYPAEIERVIIALDGVDEISVVGQKNEKWGEVPVAVVVKAKGSSIDETTIIHACNTALAKFKQPKHVFFMEALPRNAMGKVVVNEVRALVQG